MKALLLVTLSLITSSAFAVYCGDTPSQINNKLIYAEVISRSHLELELIVVGKQDAYRSKLIKVVGGKGYRPDQVPSCDTEQEIVLNWNNSSVASHGTFDYNGFVSSYRICQINVRGELRAEYMICNWETGD